MLQQQPVQPQSKPQSQPKLKKQLIHKPHPLLQNLKCYTKLGLQGKGSFGHVYLAEHKETKQQVAIKRLKKTTDKNQGLTPSFLRQASILRRLQSPSIIKLIACYMGDEQDEHDDEAYLVLEWMPTDLEKEIATNGRLGFTRTRGIVRGVLEGLWACHCGRVMHRDVKPSNILLDHDKKVIKLGDFGIAKQVHHNPKPNTPQISALYYRAPQVLVQDHGYSYPVDMWAVGCVLAQCILGRILFRGESGSELGQFCTIIRAFSINDDIQVEEMKEKKGKLKLKELALEQKPLEENIHELLTLLPATGLDLLNRLLCLDPERRIKVEQAVNHQFFVNIKGKSSGGIFGGRMSVSVETQPGSYNFKKKSDSNT